MTNVSDTLQVNVNHIMNISTVLENEERCLSSRRFYDDVYVEERENIGKERARERERERDVIFFFLFKSIYLSITYISKMLIRISNCMKGLK